MSKNDKASNENLGHPAPDRADTGTPTNPPSTPDGNRSLYADERLHKKMIACGTANGEGTKAVIRRVADESKRSPADVRSAIRFADAVDLIAENAGPAAKKVILWFLRSNS